MTLFKTGRNPGTFFFFKTPSTPTTYSQVSSCPARPNKQFHLKIHCVSRSDTWNIGNPLFCMMEERDRTVKTCEEMIYNRVAAL